MIVLVLVTCLVGASRATAEDFAKGKRRSLLKITTSELPQGKALLNGGERATPPGKRSPWHTSAGPKLLYVIEGTVTVEGTSGRTLLTCGPAAKLCLSSAKGLFYFHNATGAPVKYLVIGIDPADSPTNHEDVGQVTAISGKQVTLALGDVRTSELAVPHKEITISVADLSAIAVGDKVVTVGHHRKDHSAHKLVKLARRWE